MYHKLSNLQTNPYNKYTLKSLLISHMTPIYKFSYFERLYSQNIFFFFFFSSKFTTLPQTYFISYLECSNFYFLIIIFFFLFSILSKYYHNSLLYFIDIISQNLSSLTPIWTNIWLMAHYKGQSYGKDIFGLKHGV